MFCIEDKQALYSMMASVAQLARTPQTKQGATSMKKFAKSIQDHIENMTPWKKNRKSSGLRERLLKAGVKPGETVVFLDSGDMPNDPLYKDANVIRG